MTSEESLIKYEQDYDPEDVKCKYKVIKTTIGTLEEKHMIRMSSGRSIEELMVETFESLESFMSLFPNPVQGPAKFRYLGLCVVGTAKEHLDRLVSRDYPTDADKTPQAYVECKRNLITSLSCHTFPGDRVATFLLTDIKYIDCKDEHGNQVKPNNYLARWRKIELLGSRMEHSLGPNYIQEETFKMSFFHSFPIEMRKWMTDEHMRNPFAHGAAMDCQEIADMFQHYYTLHYADDTVDTKDEEGIEVNNSEDDDDNSYNDSIVNVEDENDNEDVNDTSDIDDVKDEVVNDTNEGTDDNDDDEVSEEEEDDNKKRKNNDEDDTNNIQDKKSRKNGRCPIPGHVDYWHDWGGCFLNPHSHKFDLSAATDFYENKTDKNTSWYRAVYEVNQDKCYECNDANQEYEDDRNGHHYHNDYYQYDYRQAQDPRYQNDEQYYYGAPYGRY